jgi:M6 family metalloprotease-like protein
MQPSPALRAVRYLCWCALVGVAVATPLSGQVPSRPAFEPAGFDFRPDGGWRVKAAQVRVARATARRAGAFKSLSAAGTAGLTIQGTLRIPVIPIAFANVPPPFPTLSYQDVFFNAAPVGRPYSLNRYYQELSNGLLQIGGQILPWVIADSVDSYYEDGCNGIGNVTPCGHPILFGKVSLRFRQLLREALTKADNGAVDWGQFDNDGLDGIPNSGDDDGRVDFAAFLQADVDGACSTPHIWSHRFALSFLGGAYLTRTPWTGHPGQWVQVDDYTIQSAVGGSDACTAGQLMALGALAHETGHTFGLPDLYDVSLATAGIGAWGLMGYGLYLTPMSPARMEAWSLEQLGWIGVRAIASDGTVALDPVTVSHEAVYLELPGTDEYLLLENRQSFASDTALIASFGPGLLMWHVDLGQIAGGGNSRLPHGVALIQADGLDDLDSAPNSDGDAGDPYPGAFGNTVLDSASIPPLRDNQGVFPGFRIDQIAQLVPNGTMTFRASFRPPAIALAIITQPGGAVSGRSLTQQPVLELRDAANQRVSQGGVVVTVAKASGSGTLTGTLVATTGTDGRATFTALTITGSGDHTLQFSAPGLAAVTSQAFPVAPTFALHLLGAGAGTGAVASQPGLTPAISCAIANGVTGSAGCSADYATGESVLLTGIPGSGSLFAGWSGPGVGCPGMGQCTLSMTEARSVTAAFEPEPEPTLAGDDLLGKPRLSAGQRLALDAHGNGNGAFDLGDFLALLDRHASVTGHRVSAVVTSVRQGHQ